MSDEIKTISDWLGTGSINIFGSPFAGKDTQGKKLADLLGGVLIGGGDILRSHDEPLEIKKVLDSGGIIPSDFYLKMVLPYLSQDSFNKKPLILSAVGRRHGEEDIILDATEKSGHSMKAVIMLNLIEQDVWKRFENKTLSHDRDDRADDAEEVIKTRLKKFKENTLPVIEYYRKKHLLIEINGALSRGEVTNEILKKLAQLAQLH